MKINKEDIFRQRVEKALSRKNNYDEDSSAEEEYEDKEIPEEIREQLQKVSIDDNIDNDILNNIASEEDKDIQFTGDPDAEWDNAELSDSEDENDECIMCKRRTGKYPFVKEKWFDKMNQAIIDGMLSKQWKKGFDEALQIYENNIRKPGNLLYQSGKVPGTCRPFPEWSVESIKNHCMDHTDDPLFWSLRVNKEFDKVARALYKYSVIKKHKYERNRKKVDFQAIDRLLKIREFQRKSSLDEKKSKTSQYYNARSGKLTDKIKKNSYSY